MNKNNTDGHHRIVSPSNREQFRKQELAQLKQDIMARYEKVIQSATSAEQRDLLTSQMRQEIDSITSAYEQAQSQDSTDCL